MTEPFPFVGKFIFPKVAQMAEMVATSYDISDVKYLDPIVEYIEK